MIFHDLGPQLQGGRIGLGIDQDDRRVTVLDEAAALGNHLILVAVLGNPLQSGPSRPSRLKKGLGIDVGRAQIGTAGHFDKNRPRPRPHEAFVNPVAPLGRPADRPACVAPGQTDNQQVRLDIEVAYFRHNWLALLIDHFKPERNRPRAVDHDFGAKSSGTWTATAS